MHTRYRKQHDHGPITMLIFDLHSVYDCLFVEVVLYVKPQMTAGTAVVPDRHAKENAWMTVESNKKERKCHPCRILRVPARLGMVCVSRINGKSGIDTYSTQQRVSKSIIIVS